MGKADPSPLVEKARAFAKMLASSEEFEEYYSAQQKLKNDREAQSLLEELEKAHQALRDAMTKGKGTSDALYDKIKKIQDRIHTNETIMSWLRAQQIAIGLIQEINEIISREAGFDFGQNASTGVAC